MVFRTKTSKKTMEIYAYIQQREYLQPYILAKISIALAIKNKFKFGGVLEDTAGLDLNRQTITGDEDAMFKCLIQLQENRHISDEEYFPDFVKAHLDRGAELLDREQKYSREFLVHLTDLAKGL